MKAIPMSLVLSLMLGGSALQAQTSQGYGQAAPQIMTHSDICTEFKDGRCVRQDTNHVLAGKGCREECQHYDALNNCKLRNSCTYDAAAGCFIKKSCEKHDKLFNCKHWSQTLICGGGRVCHEKCLRYDAFDECKLKESCTYDNVSKCIEKKECALLDTRKENCKHWNTIHICS